ncbi:MAG TPA: universal stress protein [Nitrososphaeraceae archaeon]|nr:universal stress protein [Nitrososphaeraceae archaeon]
MSSDQFFSKILVPIDGSEPSFHAARMANKIAKRFNSEIIFLYVVVSPSKYEYANLTGLVTPKQIDMIIQNAKEEAKDWFKRVEDMVKEENPNIKLSTKVILTGIAVYGEIIQYAEKESIDLIVLGTRGRSGFKKLLLGSTATGVVTYAHCPVLVTK